MFSSARISRKVDQQRRYLLSCGCVKFTHWRICAAVSACVTLLIRKIFLNFWGKQLPLVLY